MLTYVIETFTAPAKRLDALRASILNYHGFMMSEGFLGQKYHMSAESEETGRISAGGVLAHGDFPPRGLDLTTTSKELCNRLFEMREEIKRLADNVDVQVSNLSHSQDDHYCNHNRWNALVLAPTWPTSVTPMICHDCGGIVARYRVPLGEKTGADVWDWDVASDCVEACWSASGVLEEWGNRERHDPSSRLNAFGISIAKRIKSETGIDMYLYIPARESTTATTCPLCEDEMLTVESQFFWNYACPNCRTVTGLDFTP